jgi:N-methylhydantoinase B/oxoprolinase/acetone carboxylase alpha subunit
MSSFGQLFQAFKNVTQNLENAALCDHRGQTLFLKNPHAFDSGTWSEAFRWSIKYFNMDQGDVLIFNDPYAGGNDFSVFSFITCLQKAADNRSGIFLGHRVSTPIDYKDIINPGKNQFRVPLTPIAQAGQLQLPILEAMSSSSLAPMGLKSMIEKQVAVGSQIVKRFQVVPKAWLTPRYLQTYIEETRMSVLVHIKEKPWGETRIEMTLDTGETVKLNLEMSDLGVRLDFVGTSAGRDFFLPPSALTGCCQFFMSQYAGFFPFMNEGLFSVFQVSQPTTSCLSAKFPASTARGFKLGPRVLSTILDHALIKLHPKPPRGVNNYCGLYVQFQFPERQAFEFFIPNGLGATAEAEGLSGLDPFCEPVYFSAEHAENNWPLRFHRMDLRHSSLGKGKVSGGRGLIHNIEFLKKGELYWLSDMSQHKFPVLKNQTSPDKAEVIIGKEESRPLSSGFHIVEAGQTVTLGSGTGGGLI